MADTPRVTVPVEPTEAMMDAAAKSDWLYKDDPASVIYHAMLSAAPAPEGGAVSIWSDARNVFVRYAELFAMTERYEEASAIADKAAREIEALAPREEAPDWTARTEAAWAENNSEEALALENPEEPSAPENARDWPSEEAPAEAGAKLAKAMWGIDLLRAQPQAREDAQPVAWSKALEDLKSYHPEDEDLTIIKQKVVDVFEAEDWLEALAAWKAAGKPRTKLQAEQGAK